MKKTLLFALCLVLLFCTAVPFSAQSALPEGESKDLSVIYTNNSQGISVPVTDGKASGTLPAGTAFSAENLPENAVFLRIYPVQSSEKNVLEWIESCLAEELDAVISYHVSCVDAEGKELSNAGVKITVAVPETKDAVTVYALGTDGKIQSLTGSEKDGKITFTATGAQLYSFAVTVKNPGTSDRPVLLWVMASAASLTAVVSVLFLAKRRGTN